MNQQTELLKLLSDVLGTYKMFKRQNEVSFYCPECKHYKRKLQVNINTGRWHCWVCQVQNQMSGMTFYSLFKRIGASSEQYNRLTSILGTYKPIQTIEPTEVIKRLPREFISLAEPNNSPHAKHALHYLKKRGVTAVDILRYNIGYAEYGEYKHRIIVPSYDADARLNFFVARTFYDDARRYMIPSGWTKNVVVFELFINWDYPIVLVEGMFDAIAVRRNAIPLIGTTMSDYLRLQLVKHNVKTVYVALDADATRNAHAISEELNANGIETFVVSMNDKDPSVIGFEGINTLIQDAKQVSFSDIIKSRLGFST